MPKARERPLLKFLPCVLPALLLTAWAAGCERGEKPAKPQKTARIEKTRIKPDPMAAFTPDSGRPTEALPDDAGHLPSEKAVTEKRRQDTKEADVTVSLKVVFTSKDRKNTDTRIKELAGAITRQFKEYGLTNFVLLDSKELKLSPASTVPVELPGGRRLVIANSGLRDNKVVLGLEMNGLIKTTILLTQKGRFMFGGPKYKFGRGMVILVIKARRS